MSRQVALETVGDTRVFTSLSEPEPSTRRVVIMSHGFRGDSTGPARTFVDFERLLLNDGFSCFRFDQPGSGNSEGDFRESSFDRWVDTICYFATHFLDRGYEVAMLGQSMGASATLIAAARPELMRRVPCLLLWVPDPKSDVRLDEVESEEGGQRYSTRFWTEARDAEFFSALDRYPGGIHLVYGEHDQFVASDLRHRVVASVNARGSAILELAGEPHSPWTYESSQLVFSEERRFLANYFAP